MRTLQQAAKELLTYTREHSFDPFIFNAPPPESWRDCEIAGKHFRCCLSRMEGTGRHLYLLSISKPGGASKIPTKEEGDEIAAAFFPDGFTGVPPEWDILKGSRKYLADRSEVL